MTSGHPDATRPYRFARSSALGLARVTATRVGVLLADREQDRRAQLTPTRIVNRCKATIDAAQVRTPIRPIWDDPQALGRIQGSSPPWPLSAALDFASSEKHALASRIGSLQTHVMSDPTAADGLYDCPALQASKGRWGRVATAHRFGRDAEGPVLGGNGAFLCATQGPGGRGAPATVRGLSHPRLPNRSSAHQG